ncbi:MAG: helix-turn-helix transcriptional regulator [Gemmatimonadota bacterium]
MVKTLSRHRTEGGCGAVLVQYDAGTHQTPHAHDFASISMVLRGRVQENVGRHSVCASVLDTVVKPRATRHENRFLAHGTTLIQIVLADDTVRAAKNAGCPVDQWAWMEGTHTARALILLAGLVKRGAPSAVIQAAIDDSVACVGSADGELLIGRPPARPRHVRAALDDACQRGVTPPAIQTLARELGVHRVQLHREFRRHYGISPTEYRLRSRIKQAAGQVGSACQSLSQASYRAGFADQAHMTREFQARFGTTPLSYRRLVNEGH